MTSWSDDDLMTALAAALGEADADDAATTERRRTAARGAFAWREVDTELMELLHDSAVDVAGTRATSSAEAARYLSFAHSRLRLELELELDLGGTVVGEVSWASGGRCSLTLQRADGPDRAVVVDRSGFFQLEAMPPGPTRFVVEVGGSRLVTPWASW